MKWIIQFYKETSTPITDNQTEEKKKADNWLQATLELVNFLFIREYHNSKDSCRCHDQIITENWFYKKKNYKNLFFRIIALKEDFIGLKRIGNQSILLEMKKTERFWFTVSFL